MNSQIQTRILLASDETITREGLRYLLLQAPEIEIIGQVESIIATPEKVRELVPDVVLLDIGVPGRSHGLRAAANIGDLSKARIVVLTNNSDPSYVRSMLAAGVSAYLLKNSEISQLFAAVRTVKLGGRFIDPALSSDLIWHAIDKKIHKKANGTRSTFSRRELEVFNSLIRGYTNAQSAQVLKLSVKTIETYRLRICRKLHLRTRAELVEYALAHRLLT